MSRILLCDTNIQSEYGDNNCTELHTSLSALLVCFNYVELQYLVYLTIIPRARVAHELITNEVLSWLSTHYDKSEWNKCFIIYKSLINLFSKVEYHLFRQITKQSASESAVMFQFVKQTPELICMNGFECLF